MPTDLHIVSSRSFRIINTIPGMSLSLVLYVHLWLVSLGLMSNWRLEVELTDFITGGVAIFMTITRLWLRRHHYWWDDAWAFFSMIILFVQFSAVIMKIEDPEDLSRTSRVASYYLMSATFYGVIWTARTSILYSIIRIDPDPESRRRLKWLSLCFIIPPFIFIPQIFWICEPQHGWKDQPVPQCRLDEQVAICQIVTDVLADLLLITLPLRLIRDVSDKRLRHRVMFIFSASIVTTVVSLVHAAYIMTSGGNKETLSGVSEVCLSLTVANVPVVASALIRTFSKPQQTMYEPEDPDYAVRWPSTRLATSRWAWGVSSSDDIAPPNMTVNYTVDVCTDPQTMSSPSDGRAASLPALTLTTPTSVKSTPHSSPTLP